MASTAFASLLDRHCVPCLPEEIRIKSTPSSWSHTLCSLSLLLSFSSSLFSSLLFVSLYIRGVSHLVDSERLSRAEGDPSARFNKISAFETHWLSTSLNFLLLLLSPINVFTVQLLINPCQVCAPSSFLFVNYMRQPYFTQVLWICIRYWYCVRVRVEVGSNHILRWRYPKYVGSNCFLDGLSERGLFLKMTSQFSVCTDKPRPVTLEPVWS